MIDKECIAIMEHTRRNFTFCGSSKEMKQLIILGYMESIGRKSFVPDEYFKLTYKGKVFLNKREE